MSCLPKAVVSGLCALVVATSFAQAQSQANIASADAASFPSEGAISIVIISANAIAGTSAAQFAKSQSRLAKSRKSVHSGAVFDGVGERLTAQPVSGQPTLGELTLRGTNVGDVIRLEYVAGTEASLARAVEELKKGTEIWNTRSGELANQKTVLTVELTEARRVFTQIPTDETSRGLRYAALKDLKTVEADLSHATRLHADADMRMHAARGQYAAAVRNLESTRRSHVVNQKFHIIQDVYVDGRANQMDSVFRHTVGDAISQAEAHRSVPHVRIVRIQMPNSTLVAKSLRNMKAGLWVAGISAALVLEEITIGAISDKLAEKAQSHFAPTIRTELQTEAVGR